MVNPLLSLLIVIFVAILLVVVFRLGRGQGWRRGNRSRMTERVLIEDGLKHFYDAEQGERPVTLQSLAGALCIGDGRAAAIVGRIEALNLIERLGMELRLTPGGRADALRVIRLHRLWERYLAEETGLGELEWHDRADEQEHNLTEADAEALVERLGNPLYDPHGDPIPTADGLLPPQRGESLTELSPGDVAAIVHLEDEPVEVYARLVAAGLYLGMGIRLIDVTAAGIRFQADGEEHLLPPVVAANISVAPLPEEEIPTGTVEALSALDPGESATVIRIVRACRGKQRRRLMDLGILPGTLVEARMRSAGGDPTAYRVRGTLVALRREQANMIHIIREGEVA